MRLAPNMLSTVHRTRHHVDIAEPMPDIEKLKINWITAVGFTMSAFGVVFMAGFYFFEMRENSRLLREYIKRDEQRSETIVEIKTRLSVIEAYLHVDASSGTTRKYQGFKDAQ